MQAVTGSLPTTRWLLNCCGRLAAREANYQKFRTLQWFQPSLLFGLSQGRAWRVNYSPSAALINLIDAEAEGAGTPGVEEDEDLQLTEEEREDAQR